VAEVVLVHLQVAVVLAQMLGLLVILRMAVAAVLVEQVLVLVEQVEI
jgi:hypothetical protein